MSLSFFLAALLTQQQVPQRIDAAPASVAEATGGMVRDGARLEIDLDALFEERAERVHLAGDSHVEEATEHLSQAIQEERETAGLASASERPEPAEKPVQPQL